MNDCYYISKYNFCDKEFQYWSSTSQTSPISLVCLENKIKNNPNWLKIFDMSGIFLWYGIQKMGFLTKGFFHKFWPKVFAICVSLCRQGNVYSYFEKKNVHATIPKCNMWYDQYTASDTVAVEPTLFCCFPLALTNICPWPLVPFLSNFFEEQWTSKPPTIPFGIVSALFPTTFFKTAVHVMQRSASLCGWCHKRCITIDYYPSICLSHGHAIFICSNANYVFTTGHAHNWKNWTGFNFFVVYYTMQDGCTGHCALYKFRSIWPWGYTVRFYISNTVYNSLHCMHLSM